MSDALSTDTWALKKAALVYPQPVAAACGRILRTSNPQERIDATLKAAEVLTRYLCALALSSLCSRESEDMPSSVRRLEGDLAFGHYLNLVQSVAKADAHPLFAYLGAFRPSGKNKTPGKADGPLVALLELRNELGHDLVTLQRARALTIIRKHNPEERLVEAFCALEGILSLPLFVLANLRIESKQLVAQRLLLMGDSPDPIPEDVKLADSLDEMLPYVALDRRAFALPPTIIFSLIEEQSAFRLAFLDGVREGKLRY